MKPEIKKLLILNLPYLLFVWLFDKVGAAVRLSPGADASAKLLHLGDGFTAAFSSIAPSFHPADLALGIAGAVIVRLIIYTKGKNAKKYRRGTEYGSARWGGADDIKPYTDPVFENNIPLTQTERLTMNSRPKQPKYARNKNILVIGGSGSGKTRFFVKPSLMQCTSKDFPTSYIVTDPKGTLILETGKMLQRYKYRIKVLNTINFKKSMKYNPFAYLRSEKDILKLVNTIIANTMAISTRQVKNKRDSNGVLTGRPGTVYDVNIKYTAPNGEKKTYSKKGFPTKKEATQHEAEMKAKLHNPGQIASIASQRKQTVASYLNEWVESYARVNLRPSTYDGYKRTIANYITPYIGGVALNQLTPAMVDKMFQQIIDKGLKPSTAAGAKRVLSVALSHARKYRYIETNAAKDTLTKFGKSDKTPDPYTPEQVKALMQRVEGTVWEMPVILGGLYGMRRSEILGLRWRNVDLENNTFDVSEQLPFKVPPKTKVIEEMAPPKSNGRKLPITELARPFFLKQFAMQEAQREQAEKDGKPYYDNDLVVAKPDGSPISASWVSSQFGKLLEDLDMPHIRFHDLRHTAATNMHQLTGDFYTVGEVLGHTLAGIGVSLGLSMNFEAVTARYVDVRLERKKEVLDAYHGAVKQADPAKAEKAEPKKAKSAAKKKSSDLEL